MPEMHAMQGFGMSLPDLSFELLIKLKISKIANNTINIALGHAHHARTPKSIGLPLKKGYYIKYKGFRTNSTSKGMFLGIRENMNRNNRNLKIMDLNAHRIFKQVEAEAMQSCNYSKLLTRVQEVTNADPRFDKAYVLQGEIFLSLNRFNDAMKAFDKALGANPNSARAYAAKSLIYDIRNFDDKALKYCNKALECASSNDSDLLVSLFDQKLSILSRMKDYEAINSTLLNAESLLPKEDFAYLSDFYAQETRLRLVAIS